MATDDSSHGTSAGDGAGARWGHVFISHHSSQYDAAKQVKAALAQAGIRGWLAPDDVDPGSAYDTRIVEAMRDARAMVLLLCPQSDRSRHVKRELMLADDENKPVFPVRLEKVKAEGLAYWLQDYQWIDWFGGKGDGLDRLVEAIRETFALPPGPPSSRPPATAAPRQKRALLLGGGAMAAFAVAAVAVWLLIPAAASREPYFTPGLWLNKREMIEVTYPKLPEDVVQQLKQSVENDPNPEECISDAVARKPDVNLFDPGNKGGCTLTSFQLGSGRMTGYLTCPRPSVKGGVMAVVFRGTYTKNAIVLDQDVTLSEPAGEVKFKARDSSHWVANACPNEIP
jgi:hypothetical protein